MAKIAIFWRFYPFLGLNMAFLTPNGKTMVMRGENYDVLANSWENFFWSWATSLCSEDLQSHRKIYIFCIFFQLHQLQNEVGQLQIFLKFFKLPDESSNIHFQAREAIKTRWDRAFWKKFRKKSDFCWWNPSQLLRWQDIYHAGQSTDEYTCTFHQHSCYSNFEVA